MIVTVRGMFGGLGGLKEGIATARKECAEVEEIARRAPVAYLWEAKQEVLMARSSLRERPDALNYPNIALAVAGIELDHACSMAPDTTVSNRIRRIAREVRRARGEMAITEDVTVRWLDRICTEIDEVVKSFDRPDTTAAAPCSVLE